MVNKFERFPSAPSDPCQISQQSAYRAQAKSLGDGLWLHHLKIVNALEPFQKGEITVNGIKLHDPKTNLPTLRRTGALPGERSQRAAAQLAEKGKSR